MSDALRVTIQYFEGCPHWRVADERVRKVLAGLSRSDVQIEHQLIESEDEAERVGFHGSPTILLDGRDPFATGNEQVGLACRVYPTEEGSRGAPSESRLRAVLTRG